MSDRQDIATALSTVDGIQGFKYRPTVVNTGDAFPLWAGETIALAQNYEVSWKILVVLPKTERDAGAWVDEKKHHQIADALLEVGYGIEIEPGTLSTEAGERDLLIFTLRKEA